MAFYPRWALLLWLSGENKKLLAFAIFDSLVTRPILLYLGPKYFGFAVGKTVGSITADILFYGTIFLFGLSKHN